MSTSWAISEPARADITLWAGVIISVVGAVLATPAGTAFATSSVARVLSRPFRRPVTVDAPVLGTGSAMLQGLAVIVATGTVGSSQVLTVEERLDELRAQIAEVKERLETTTSRLEEDLDQLTSEVAETADALVTELRALRARMAAAEEEAAKVDGRALPVIVAGIVISAAAEYLSRLPTWLWALLTAAAVACSLVIMVRGIGAHRRARTLAT